MRLQRFLVPVILIAVGATACSSSSKSAAKIITSTTQGPAAASGASGTSGPTTTIKLSGNSGSSFCDLARNDEKAIKGLKPGTTPDDLRTLYANIGPALSEAESKAPSEIKGDFKTFADAFAQVVHALAAVNYDATKLSESTFSSLDVPAVKAAGDHIQQYFTQVCHIDTAS
jgi:hypothetical protein